MFWAIDYLCLALLIICAVLVVALRNLNGSVVALSAVGTVLTVLFVALGAPDDAHSEAVVGAIALPTLYLITIGKIRVSIEQDEEGALGEEGDESSPVGPQ
ncbi:MAG TPA: hydrogenase subunit MbhD domain-containing protein [Acidimicrobiales bacterium]|nr:hydrogenase subunit MbhD domain-containing protein [Acidimicrobiales bacterium]